MAPGYTKYNTQYIFTENLASRFAKYENTA